MELIYRCLPRQHTEYSSEAGLRLKSFFEFKSREKGKIMEGGNNF